MVQKLAEGGVALCTASGYPLVQVGSGCRGFAAGLGEEPGLAGRNMAPGPESHSLLVPAVHKIPSKQNTETQNTSDTTEENTHNIKIKLTQ